MHASTKKITKNDKILKLKTTITNFECTIFLSVRVVCRNVGW